MRRRIARTVCAGLLLVCAAAHAHGYAIGDLRVQHPWTRTTVPGTSETPAFMRIYNHGHIADRLLSGSSPIAGRVELRADNRPTAAIDLPPRTSVTLQPGGPHLLLADLARPLRKGGRIILLLRFERAGELRVEAEVQSPDSKRPQH